jgi:ornithine cyclodeaminase/alanine dehydrogenase-like protein (mu-crystallin family)
MTLLLKERDVERLVNMRESVPAVEEVFQRLASSEAANSQRTRTIVPGSVLNVMHAASPYLGRAGVKAYLATREGAKFVFLLFDTRAGNLLSVMGADILGRYRTGAASAVATKHLAHLSGFQLGLAGAGKQAMTQVAAMKEIANLEGVRVWSPTQSRAEEFATRVQLELGIKCNPAESPLSAFRGSQVATTITTSKDPFITPDTISDVIHVNACGSNTPERAELTEDVVHSFAAIFVDDKVQAMQESGDLIQAVASKKLDWSSVIELKDIFSATIPPKGKTLFKSSGIAAEDVAVASLVYDKAMHSGEFEDRDFDFFID